MTLFQAVFVLIDRLTGAIRKMSGNNHEVCVIGLECKNLYSQVQVMYVYMLLNIWSVGHQLILHCLFFVFQ